MSIYIDAPPNDDWIKQVSAPAPAPAPGPVTLLDQLIAKHADHDQSDHGNWARGLTTYKIDDGKLPDAYRSRMDTRLAKLGITPEMLDAQVEKYLAAGDPVGAEWYSLVNDNVEAWADELNEADPPGQLSDIDPTAVAATVAAMSPMREFGKNMDDARTMLAILDRDQLFTPTAEDIAEYNANRPSNRNKYTGTGEVLPSSLDASVLAGLHPRISALANRAGMGPVIKAIAVAKGGNPEQILGGPKVRAFYSNMVNPSGSHTTIDTWMYRGMIPKNHVFPSTAGVYGGMTLGEIEAIRTPDDKKKYGVGNIFQSSPGPIVGTGVPSNVGTYPAFAESVERVAASHDLLPHQVQAIVWDAVRVENGYKSTDLDSYRTPASVWNEVDHPRNTDGEFR